MKDKKLVTRRQLRGYGATEYLAKKITRDLTPVETRSRAYVYDVRDAIAAIRNYQQNPRIQAATRSILEQILKELINYLGNVVKVPFGADNKSELALLVNHLMQAMNQTDRILADLKTKADATGLEEVSPSLYAHSSAASLS